MLSFDQMAASLVSPVEGSGRSSGCGAVVVVRKRGSKVAGGLLVVCANSLGKYVLVCMCVYFYPVARLDGS